jgi:hypothetical protein
VPCRRTTFLHERILEPYSAVPLQLLHRPRARIVAVDAPDRCGDERSLEYLADHYPVEVRAGAEFVRSPREDPLRRPQLAQPPDRVPNPVQRIRAAHELELDQLPLQPAKLAHNDLGRVWLAEQVIRSGLGSQRRHDYMRGTPTRLGEIPWPTGMVDVPAML